LLKDDLLENLNSTQSIIQKNSTETQNDIFKVIDSQLKTIEKEEITIEAQLKEKIVDEFESLNSEMISAKNDTLSFFSNTIQDLERDPQLFKDKITKLTNTQLNSLEHDGLLLNESIKTTNSNFIIQFKNIMSQLQDRFTETSNKYYNGLKDHLLALEKDINSITDDRIISLKDKITLFQENLINLLEKGSKYLENVQTYENEIIMDLKRQVEIMKKSANIITNNVSNLMDTQISDYNIAAESFKSYYSKSINKELSTTEENFTNLLNQINNSFEDNSKNVKNNFDTFEKEIPNIIDASFLEYKTSYENLNDNLKIILNSHLKDYSALSKAQKAKLKPNIDQIEDILNSLNKKLTIKITNTINKNMELNEKMAVDLESNLSKISKQNYNNFQSELSNLINKISLDFKNSIKNFKNNINALNNDLFQNLNTFQSNVQKGVTKTKDDISKTINSQLIIIEKECNTLETQLKEKITKEYEQLSSEMNLAKDEATTFFTKYIADLEKDSTLIKDKITKLLSSQINSLEKDLLLLNESIKTTISIFTSQFVNVIEIQQNRAIETSNKYYIGLKDHFATLTKDFFNIIDERANSSKSKIISFQEQFSTIIEKRLKYFENIKAFEKRISQNLKRHIEMIKKSTTIVTDNITNLMDKQISDFNLASESFKSYYAKIINKEINSSEESLTNLLIHMNNTFQENKKNTKNIFGNLKLEIPKVFEDSRLEHNKIDETLGKDVTDLVNTYFLDWRVQIDKIRNELEFVTKHIDNAEKNSRQFQSNIRENFLNQIEKFEISIKDYLDRLNGYTNSSIKNLKTFLNSLKAGKEKATANLITQIKNSIN
ncbi:MAG: hypothetical protein ACFFCM_23055, partial [Promethearchaeota archaeon]